MSGELQFDEVEVLIAGGSDGIGKGLAALCDVYGDIATAGLLETWTDEAEGRVWCLSAMSGG